MLDSFHLLDPRRKLKAAFLHVPDEALKNISIRYDSNFSFEKNSAFSPNSVTRACRNFIYKVPRDICVFDLIGQMSLTCFELPLPDRVTKIVLKINLTVGNLT